MSRIETELRGKRPRFFPQAGTDETISMLLEMAAELWTVKERLYALERSAAAAGLELTPRIEAWQPNAAEAEELDAERQRMIASILRAIEARHVPGAHLRRALDDEAAATDSEATPTASKTAVQAA